MEHNTKIRYHFDNHSSIILKLSDIEADNSSLTNVIYKGQGGAIKARSLCTGFKDQSGVDIFENDVVRYNRNGYDIFSYVEYNNGFGIVPNISFHMKNNALMHTLVTVVGNLIDNPELSKIIYKT